MNYNLVVLAGNLTRTPELRHGATSNTPYCSTAIAVNRYSRNLKPEVSFFECTFFDKNAENLCKYCNKGSNILIQGSLSINSYRNKDGVNIQQPRIIVQSFQMVGSRQTNDTDNDQATYASMRKNIDDEVNVMDKDYYKSIGAAKPVNDVSSTDDASNQEYTDASNSDEDYY